MILFKKIKNDSWHISTNEDFSLCKAMDVKNWNRKLRQYLPQEMEVILPHEADDNVKDNLCRACVLQAYKEGLLKVDFK